MKILKEMGVPDHLTCLLRNLYVGQEATLEPDMEPWAGSKLGKDYVKAVYCHPAYLTSMQSTSCEMPGWMKHNLESRLQREISQPQICKWCHPNGFSSGHVWIWELDYKEGSEPKNWCFQIMVLKQTLESPLDSKEINPVNSKGNQPWIFIGRTETEAEAPTLWPSDMKSQLSERDLDAGKDWRPVEKGTTENEMFGWHHQLNRHESIWADSGR